MNRIGKRANAVFLLVMILLGGLGFFVTEYLQNGSKWVMTYGNPHVYHGDKLIRGQVVDREGVFLMELGENRTYAAALEIREATLHWLGDRKGNIHAPLLRNYRQQLVGFNPVTGLYTYSNQDQAVLTISAQVQMTALEALGERKGTVAVYNYKTGELLCAVTSPTYDPDHEPQQALEGMYMNRFLQSAYVPGSIFKIVTTAAAIEYIPDIQEQTFHCTGRVEYGPDAVTCEKAHGKLDFDSAMAQSCNCAYARIIEQIGQKRLADYVGKTMVTQSVHFDGITSASGNFDVTQVAPVELAWSGIGQHTDQINPARFLTFVGAIANGGQGPKPHIMAQVKNGDKIIYEAETLQDDRIIPEEVALELQRMMRNNVTEKYGDDNFPGLTVCAKSGTGQVGGELKANAMFAGFVADEAYPLAFVVAVEEGGYGRTTCVPIIAKVLKSCTDVMDRS